MVAQETYLLRQKYLFASSRSVVADVRCNTDGVAQERRGRQRKLVKYRGAIRLAEFRPTTPGRPRTRRSSGNAYAFKTPSSVLQRRVEHKGLSVALCRHLSIVRRHFQHRQVEVGPRTKWIRTYRGFECFARRFQFPKASERRTQKSLGTRMARRLTHHECRLPSSEIYSSL